jgi:hypothetical protein
LTKCGNLSEAEVEETETATVVVKMAKMTEGMAMRAAVAAIMEKMAAVTETAVVDITDGRGGGRQHIGGNTGL